MQKTRFSANVLLVVLVIAALALTPGLAFAETAGDVADNLKEQLGPFANLVVGAMFLGGIVLGGMSAFKFKAHGENPQNEKLTKPVIYALASALLIGLPAYVSMTKETVLGDGAAGSLDDGAYEAIE